MVRSSSSASLNAHLRTDSQEPVFSPPRPTYCSPKLRLAADLPKQDTTERDIRPVGSSLSRSIERSSSMMFSRSIHSSPYSGQSDLPEHRSPARFSGTPLRMSRSKSDLTTTMSPPNAGERMLPSRSQDYVINFRLGPKLAMDASPASRSLLDSTPESLKSSFQDSDEEEIDELNEGRHASRYNGLGGRLLRPLKAKDRDNRNSVLKNHQSHSSPLSHASPASMQSSGRFSIYSAKSNGDAGSSPSPASRESLRARAPTASLEASIATFFGIPPPKRDSGAPSYPARAVPVASSRTPSKEVRILGKALGLGLGVASPLELNDKGEREFKGANVVKMPKDAFSTSFPTSKAIARTQIATAMPVAPPRPLSSPPPFSDLFTHPSLPGTVRDSVSAKRPEPPKLTYNPARRPALPAKDERRPVVDKSGQNKTASSELERAESSSSSAAAPANEPSPSAPCLQASKAKTADVGASRGASTALPNTASAARLKRRPRNATYAGGLPPAKPPPSTVLPPIPTQLPEVSKSGWRTASQQAPPSCLELPPFKAIVTDFRRTWATEVATSHAAATSVELNVGGKKFLTSTTTLFRSSRQKSRLALFITQEIDKITAEAKKLLSDPIDDGLTMESHPVAATPNEITGRIKARRARQRGKEMEPTSSSSGSDFDGTSRSMGSSYWSLNQENDSDYLGCTSSTSTAASDKDDDGDADRSICGSDGEYGALQLDTGGRKARSLFSFELSPRPSATELRLDVMPPLTPTPIMDLGDRLASPRIDDVLDKLIAEQSAYFSEGKQQSTDPCQTHWLTVSGGVSVQGRRTSNTLEFCPSDVGDDDEEEDFGHLTELFPSPDSVGAAKTSSHLSGGYMGAIGRARSDTLRTISSSEGTGDATIDSGFEDASGAILFTAVSPTTPEFKRVSILPVSNNRKTQPAFSLQQVPRPGRQMDRPAKAPSQLLPTVASLSVFLDRQPKCYSALLHVLEDGTLPAKYRIPEAREAPRPDGRSSSCSSPSSNSNQSLHGSSSNRSFKLGSVDDAKKRKTLARLAELREEAAWLGYTFVVELCEEQENIARTTSL